MKLTIPALVAAMILCITFTASAECSKNEDCEDDKVCVDGECQSNETTADAEKETAKASGESESITDTEETAEATQDAASTETDTKTEEKQADGAAGATVSVAPEASIQESVDVEETEVEVAQEASIPQGKPNLVLAPAAIGLALTGGVIGTHVYLALNLADIDNMSDKDQQEARYASWGVGMSAFALYAPTVYAAGKRLKNRNPGVKGSGFLPVLGWVSYVLYLELGLMTFGMSEVGTFDRHDLKTGERQYGLESFVGLISIFGVTSLVAFSAEALIVRKQVLAKTAAPPATAKKTKVEWIPNITPVGVGHRVTGATFGFTGLF